MKTINKLLPLAIEVAKEKLVKDCKIDAKMNGYFSSFGASILSAGILPTVIFYNQADDEKAKIIMALNEMCVTENKLSTAENTLPKYLKSLIEQKNGKYEMNLTKLTTIENFVKEACVALKLAIRIFPKAKAQNN